MTLDVFPNFFITGLRVNQSVSQSIVLLALLQFPKTELQVVHTQLEKKQEEN